MKFVQKSLLVAVLALLPIRSAYANVIVNGGFESPDIPSNSFFIFAAIPGWTTTFGGGIEVQDNVAGAPFEGAQHVELDSDQNSGMVQFVPTTPNSFFDVFFEYSPRPGVGAASNGIEFYFDGVLIDSLAQNGGNATNWSLHSYHLMATSNLTPVEFRAIGTSDSLGGYLDDVRMEQSEVPEPASLMLLGMGLSIAIGRRLKARG